jgi:hypothetical protein
MKPYPQAEQLWDQRLAELVAYKQRVGDCLVPHHSATEPHLGEWVYHQRKYQREGRLSPERFARLSEIGFAWECPAPPGVSWEQRLAQLAAYKERHGHCNVPHEWSEDPGLGQWVATQRKNRKQGRLTPERVRQLLQLGFQWNRLPLVSKVKPPLPAELVALNLVWKQRLADLRKANNYGH